MTKSYKIIEGGVWEIETTARPFGKDGAHITVPADWAGETVRVRRTENNENKLPVEE